MLPASGTSRGRRTRALPLQALLLLVSVCVIAAVGWWTGTALGAAEGDGGARRRLSGEDSQCPALSSWEDGPGVIVHVLALLYIFMGLAVICDDFFVASLEQISDYLSLSEDVAGATFMAAGSSAPELFISLADNVIAEPGKTIGVSTIVGSAIFNILVIIAVTGMLAGQSLELDWKPLARDTVWYSLSIALLIAFTRDEIVEWWESVLFIVGYAGYIIQMVFNQRIFDWLDSKVTVDPRSEDEKEAAKKGDHHGEAVAVAKRLSAGSGGLQAGDLAVIHLRQSALEAHDLAIVGDNGRVAAAPVERMTIDVMTDLTAKSSEREGEAQTDGDGRPKLKRTNSDPELERANSGTASWRSSHHDMTRQRARNPLLGSKFRAFRHRKAGLARTLTRSSYCSEDAATGSAPRKSSRASRESSRSSTEANEAAASAPVEVAALQKQLEAAEKTAESGEATEGGDAAGAGGGGDDDDEELGEYWDPVVLVPDDFVGKLWFFTMWPWYFGFKLTIPDCRFDRFSGPKGFWGCFVMSILWIGLQCWLITYFIERIGCVIGAPHSLMALTVVAAGTSVPDALASVIVARSGQGDMAVSNAIGSNVFDIMLGLGIPFLISSLIYDKPVSVATDKLMASIYLLFGIVIAVVGIIHFSGWLLSPRVGKFLFVLYFGYVAFAAAYGMS